MTDIKQYTIKINTAALEWHKTATRAYGFLKGILVFVIRFPVETDRLGEKKSPWVLHDLFYDQPVGVSSIEEGMLEGQKLLRSYWGKRITMPRLKSQAELNNADADSGAAVVQASKAAAKSPSFQ